MSEPKYTKTVRKLTRTGKYVLVRLPVDWVPEAARWAACEYIEGKIVITPLK